MSPVATDGAPPPSENPEPAAYGSAARMDEVFAILREEADFTESMRSKPAARESAETAAGPDTARQSPVPGPVTGEPRKRKFGVEIFFAVSLLLAVLGIVYGNSEYFSAAIPEIEAQISAFVSFVDGFKSGLIQR